MPTASSMRRREVRIPAASAHLDGVLTVPDRAGALVVFAHGSGSSRHSSRNQFVAQTLNDLGFATLLFDLLTLPEERADARTGHLRFDISLLAERLVLASDWVRAEPGLEDVHLGYFGASTGAAAALVAASRRPAAVDAVVSRGGRPDLATTALALVRAPTLLIVGALDSEVLELNRRAQAQLSCISQLAVVPRATHLFPEEGTLEEAARLAGDWFSRFLGSRDRH